jgi:hypothetical protein
MEEIEKLINELIEQQMLVRGVVSSPNHGAILKVTIRPLLIKGEYCYQFTSFDGKQTRDLNASPGAAADQQQGKGHPFEEKGAARAHSARPQQKKGVLAR